MSSTCDIDMDLIPRVKVDVTALSYVTCILHVVVACIGTLYGHV